MTLTTYDKGLAVKSLVLLELRDAGMPTGEELIARVEALCARIVMTHPEFDFVGWVNTTIWGLLDTFAASGFIAHSGSAPRSTHDWSITTLRISPLGERFLENARLEAAHVFQMIEGEVAPRAAAG